MFSSIYLFNFRCEYIIGADGNAKPFTIADQEDLVANVIEPMAMNGLRTICVAFKDFVRGNATEFQ